MSPARRSADDSALRPRGGAAATTLLPPLFGFAAEEGVPKWNELDPGPRPDPALGSGTGSELLRPSAAASRPTASAAARALPAAPAKDSAKEPRRAARERC